MINDIQEFAKKNQKNDINISKDVSQYIII